MRLAGIKMPRKRVLIASVVAVILVVLTLPLWVGYFGPRTVAWVHTWLPWRSGLSVQVNPKLDAKRPHDVHFIVTYDDPWPGSAHSAGPQTRFVTVARASSLLPWAVKESGTGP